MKPKKNNSRNNKIKKLNNHVYLYYYYQEFLTPKQKEVFEMYYYDDMTLEEISKVRKVTKIAIYDSLKKTESFLEEIENKIKLKTKVDFLNEGLTSLKETATEEQITIIETMEKIF